MNKRKRSFLSLFISPSVFFPLPAKAKTKQLPHFIPLPSIQAARHILSLFYPALWRGAHQQRPGSRVLILVGVESRYAKKIRPRGTQNPLSLTRPQSPSVPSTIHTRDMEERAGARGNILILLGISQAFSKRFLAQ